MSATQAIDGMEMFSVVCVFYLHLLLDFTLTILSPLKPARDLPALPRELTNQTIR